MKTHKNSKIIFPTLVLLLLFSAGFSLANEPSLSQEDPIETKIEENIYGIDKIINRIKIKREEFKQKVDWSNSGFLKTTNSSIVGIEKIKDENKKDSVVKIINGIEELNTKYIEILSLNINKIEDILAKIEFIMFGQDDNLENEKELSPLGMKALEIDLKIDLAREEIIKQVKTRYVLTITSEESLREDIKIIRDRFQERIDELFLMGNDLKLELESLISALTENPGTKDGENKILETGNNIEEEIINNADGQ